MYLYNGDILTVAVEAMLYLGLRDSQALGLHGAVGVPQPSLRPWGQAQASK